MKDCIEDIKSCKRSSINNILLVVDFNVVFSSLVNKGVSYKVFLFNSFTKKFKFIAPEYVWIEFEKDREKLYDKTKYTLEEFNKILQFLKDEIELVPNKEFTDFLSKAEEFLKEHKKDSPYLALALAFNCGIFSGDPKLKELALVKVHSPKELLEVLVGKRGL